MLFSGEDIDHRLDRLARRSSPSAAADRVVLAGVTVAGATTIVTTCTVLHTRWLTAGVLACAGLTALLTYLLLPLRTHA